MAKTKTKKTSMGQRADRTVAAEVERLKREAEKRPYLAALIIEHRGLLGERSITERYSIDTIPITELDGAVDRFNREEHDPEGFDGNPVAIVALDLQSVEDYEGFIQAALTGLHEPKSIDSASWSKGYTLKEIVAQVFAAGVAHGRATGGRRPPR